MHAVYALCRLADDIVDEPDKTPHPSVPAHGTPTERLDAFRAWFFAALARGTSDEPVMASVIGHYPHRNQLLIDAGALALLIVILLVRPQGILGRRERIG